MKEYKYSVDLTIANLQQLSKALEEENVATIATMFVTSTISFAMMINLIENAIKNQNAQVNQEEFPDIIDEESVN